jgi:chlorophyllide a reductase subunit Y
MVVSGYEGSELLVARLLMEAGAEIPYVGTALPRTEWSAADREWLEARGTHVQFRASLEQDVAAMRDVQPDLALGTTPLVQAAKEQGVPAVYFTNMVSARPLFGAAGCAALPAIVAAQTAGRERFGRMVAFFEKPVVKTPVVVPTVKKIVKAEAV